jgi:hypothetical protein
MGVRVQRAGNVGPLVNTIHGSFITGGIIVSSGVGGSRSTGAAARAALARDRARAARDPGARARPRPEGRPAGASAPGRGLSVEERRPPTAPLDQASQSLRRARISAVPNSSSTVMSVPRSERMSSAACQCRRASSRKSNPYVLAAGRELVPAGADQGASVAQRVRHGDEGMIGPGDPRRVGRHPEAPGQAS